MRTNINYKIKWILSFSIIILLIFGLIMQSKLNKCLSFSLGVISLPHCQFQSSMNCNLVLFICIQAWNHEFFWESMKPGGGGKPSGELLELIERDFGSFDRFLKEFKSAAATQFGSGWAWLACK